MGILASPATNSSGLFGDFLAGHGGVSAYPENEAGILASTRRIKQSGPTQVDIRLLENEAAALVRRGAERVIVGCSEFSMISDRIQTSVPILDTLDVLISVIVKFSGVRVKLPT